MVSNVEISSEADGGTSKVYVSDDPSKYNDSNYDGYSHAWTRSPERRLCKGSHLRGSLEKLCRKRLVQVQRRISVTTTIPTFRPPVSPLRGVLFGGTAAYGADAGLAFASSSYAPLVYECERRVSPLLYPPDGISRLGFDKRLVALAVSCSAVTRIRCECGPRLCELE